MKKRYRLTAALFTSLLFLASGCGSARPYTPPLANESELKINIGKTVTIIGTASDALKAGPAILMGEVPIYLPSIKIFPENVPGKKIQVTGKLEWIESPPPNKDELPSAQLSNHYKIQDPQWILLESLRPR